MSSNKAAYLANPQAKALEIREAPYPTPGSQEVVIQTAAVAINPLEKNIQDYNPPIGGKPLSYPLLMGSDVAGTIISIGTQVTDRHIGQRVVLNAHGVTTGEAAKAGFQHFVLAGAARTIPIPDSIAFEDAVVLPLACDTAAAGLFSDDLLNLSLSALQSANVTSSSASPAPKGTILIWGGSSSVGCCAIQFASAAGYRVFTTASPHNHGLCLSLGAGKVFDHRAPDIEQQILSALAQDGGEGKLVGALDCIADKSKTMPVCARILSKAGIGEGKKKKKRLVTVLRPPEEELAAGVQALRLNIPPFVQSAKYAVVHDWIAKALADGTLQCKPDAKIVGHGLESIQKGIDILRQGVSASKLVVVL